MGNIQSKNVNFHKCNSVFMLWIYKWKWIYKCAYIY